MFDTLTRAFRLPRAVGARCVKLTIIVVSVVIEFDTYSALIVAPLVSKLIALFEEAVASNPFPRTVSFSESDERRAIGVIFGRAATTVATFVSDDDHVFDTMIFAARCGVAVFAFVEDKRRETDGPT